MYNFHPQFWVIFKGNYTMKKPENLPCYDLYQRHVQLLKLQGKAKKTVDSYSRAICRVTEYFSCCPSELNPEQLQDYFAALVESHSWSTVKIDRLGLQFYWKHVLYKDWDWINIVKPPKVKTIPDILTPSEIERLIGATRKLRYRVFLLVTYSMGLRLEEALSLQVSDIDAERHLIHIRRGKGAKDRMVPLPDLTLKALRTLWTKHRHSSWLFPNARGTKENYCKAKNHMDRGAAQQAMKRVVEECGIKKKYPSIRSGTAGQLTFS
jgi:integrase/recombinase XerD